MEKDQKVRRICPQCGMVLNGENWKVCPHCGRSLTAEAPEAREKVAGLKLWEP